MINTDVHFVKGNSHDICEDYGLCSSIREVPYIIVADGCSTGYHSDIASRIISHACRNATNSWTNYFNIKSVILDTLVKSSELLGLGDLLSTLIVAFEFGNNIYVYFYGDGYLVYKYEDEEKEIIEVDYEDNVPNYIWYSKNTDLYKIDNSKMRINGSSSHNPWWTIHSDNIEYVAIMTDGINSFIKNKDIEGNPFGNTITGRDAINHLLDFKSMNGKFVTRRMNRFLKTTQQYGFIHDDDICCAVMSFGE